MGTRYTGIISVTLAFWSLAAEARAAGTSASTDQRPWTGYVRIERPQVVAKAGVSSNVIYLNRCAEGCALVPGFDDSRENKSSIIDAPVSIPPFSHGDASWQAVVECVRELYAPFDVEITDVDPGDAPHFEAIVAGDPADAGYPSYVGGVAPYDCGGIDNAITYTFADIWGDQPRIICEVVAQETAHAFGLDHELYCPDPMTYITGCGDKRFRDFDAKCGEDSERACECGGETQNSYQMLLATFGAGELIDVQITEPRDGQEITSAFTVRADATYGLPIEHAALYIDGELAQTSYAQPYVFEVQTELTQGAHQLEVRAYSSAGGEGSHAITVFVGTPCQDASHCSDDQICLEGRCVLGPGHPGGLGEACTSGSSCASGLCGENSSGDKHCIEACQLGGDGCPCGFRCVSGEDGGVCWPGGDECGGGCAASMGGRGSPVVPILLGVAFGAIFLRRRPHA